MNNIEHNQDVTKDSEGQSLLNDGLEVRLDDALLALGMTPEWEIENIKETAMARHHVKKGRRLHVKRILDEAFELLAKHTPNVEVSGRPYLRTIKDK